MHYITLIAFHMLTLHCNG